MKVNLAICGRFHYHNYVRYLDHAGVLSRFYYSHRLSTNARALGLASERACNLWLKEYLYGLHGRFAPDWLTPGVGAAYADLWQMQALAAWRPCDMLHVMLHGAAHRLIARAQAEHSTIVGEAVNQHPRAMLELLGEEYAQLGLRAPEGLNALHRRQLVELEKCDFVLAPSRLVARSFTERGFDPQRIAVIPYGVDRARFASQKNTAPVGSRPFQVICVAQLTPRKGHIYLVQAWRRLRLPKAQLVLIGACSADMERVLVPYRDCFTHITAVPNQRLVRFYGNSSVFVLPSIEDGFGVVCTEAMAAGLPVITTANTGAAEIIREGEDGFVVPSRSVEALAARIEQLYLKPELCTWMGQNAQARARSELGWEPYAAKLIAFYRAACRHAGPNLTSATAGRA